MYEEERLTVLEMDLPDSTPVVLGVQKLWNNHSIHTYLHTYMHICIYT